MVSEKNLKDINFKRLEKVLVYIKNNLFDSDNNLYLPVDSLTDINILMTDSNKITLRKVNLKPFGYDKMYMDKDLIEDILS